MVYWSLLNILTLFLDVFTILGITQSDKDLEIIILRQQVRILQRKGKSTPRLSHHEKMVLAILMDKFKHSTGDARIRTQYRHDDFQAGHSPSLASRNGST